MNIVEKFLAILVAISPIKYLCGTFVYLNIFFPLVGFIRLFKYRDFYFLFFPILVSCFLNLIVCFFHLAPMESYLRIFQLILIIHAAMYVSAKSSDFFPNLILRVFFPVLILDFLCFMIFYFFGNVSHSRFVFGFVVPRYVGLAGDPNYSGVLCAIVAMILFSFRQYIKFFVGLVIFLVSLFTISRTILIVYIVFCLGLLMGRKLLKIYCWLMLSLLFLFPVSLLLVDSYASMDDKVYLTKLTSTRYPFWVAYCSSGIQSPFGSGYFNSLEDALNFIDVDLLLHDDLSGYVNQDLVREKGVRSVFIEQHSLQLQVLSDFGVFGYLSFWFLILVLIWGMLRSNNKEALIIVCSLVGYTFMNALSEWALWCSIAFGCSFLNFKPGWPEWKSGSINRYFGS